MKLGGHLSIAEGLRYAPVNARAMGYTCFQTMLSVGGDYRPFQIEQAQLDEFKKLMFGLDLYVHMPYLINTCEGAAQKRGFYRATFMKFYRLAGLLGAKAVVVHPGHKKDLEERIALSNTVHFIERLLEEGTGPYILIETDAGSKNQSAIGSLEFIDEVLTQVGDARIRMCLDTEHLWARGVNMWDAAVRASVLSKFGKWVELVHLNGPNPGVELGSRIDRHNSTFKEFKAFDSRGLVKDMLEFPCVLERQSLALQREEVRYIVKAMQ